MPKGITDVGGLLNDIMLWLMVKPYRCKNKQLDFGRQIMEFALRYIGIYNSRPIAIYGVAYTYVGIMRMHR